MDSTDRGFDPACLPSLGGSYVLQLVADASINITIGRFAELPLMPGDYFYVGSAFGPGGLRARLGRHARQDKPLRWHIDYLRQHTRLDTIIYSTATARLESAWAAALEGMDGLSIPLPGFGASDCKRESHLFHAVQRPALDGLLARLAVNGAAAPQVVRL